MKTLWIVLTALYPFLHETSYEAEVTGCNVDTISIVSEKSNFEISLFNTAMLSDEGWTYVCEILEEADQITFEIDATSQIEGIVPVYLFADEILINEELMKKGYAYPAIRNPNYKYEQRLEEAYDSTQVFQEQEEIEETTKKRYPIQGPLFVVMLSIIWILTFVFLRKTRKRRKNIKKYDKIKKGKEAQ